MLKLKDFFYLQRNDRQAILVLLGIIIICLTLIIIVGKINTTGSSMENDYSADNNPKSMTGDNQESSTADKNISEKHPIYYKVEGTVHELFPFDPNTADSTQLLKLGLQSWQVRSIYRFRAKGGIFREKTDFARLYGLTKKQYEVLAPYIIIGEDYRPASDYYGNSRGGKERGYHNSPYKNGANTSTYSQANNGANSTNANGNNIYSYPQKLRPGQHVIVNSADTTELMKIPGIGSYYAKSIKRYREQLGGFASINQLKEIDGLPEEALSFIKITPGEVRKLNINSLSLNQLRRHPYLNFYQAKEICDYRRLRGPFKSLEELKLLKNFPPAEIERLKPYIIF